MGRDDRAHALAQEADRCGDPRGGQRRPGRGGTGGEPPRHPKAQGTGKGTDMPYKATCPLCAKTYEARSQAEASAPDRTCGQCRGILTVPEDLKATIDGMTQYDLCRMWRFSKSGNILLQGETGKYFETRLKEKGGFTPEISKSIGLG